MPERRFPTPWTVEETDAEPLPGAPVALPQLLPFRPVKLLPGGVIGGLCDVCQSARTAGAPAVTAQRVNCVRTQVEGRQRMLDVIDLIDRASEA